MKDKLPKHRTLSSATRPLSPFLPPGDHSKHRGGSIARLQNMETMTSLEHGELNW